MEEMNTNTGTQLEGNQAGAQQTEPAGGRMFSQDEVNRIVQERLARAKTSNEPDQRELDLQARENALYAREKVAEADLPKELADELKEMDKETIDKCLKIIAPYAQLAKEPFLNPVGPINSQYPGASQDSAIRAAMGLFRKR